MTNLMGANPMGRSYIAGYSDDYAKHPHHTAAHESTTNNLLDPPDHRHIPRGALVGGPDSSDLHVDATDDYMYNEVAIDYNAGLAGALAGLYEYFGRGENHQPLANFPPPEEITGEHYLLGKTVQDSNERTRGTVLIFGQLFLPPFFETRLMCRYFFDKSELIDIGQSIADVMYVIPPLHTTLTFPVESFCIIPVFIFPYLSTFFSSSSISASMAERVSTIMVCSRSLQGPERHADIGISFVERRLCLIEKSM